jgi:hypothetical protein
MGPSATPASATTPLVEDQISEGSGLIPYGNGIDFFKLAQTFIPTADNLAALDLLIQNPASAQLRISIRNGSPSGAEIGYMDANLDPQGDFYTWRRFTFASPIPLTAGNTYAIVLTMLSGQAFWITD